MARQRGADFGKLAKEHSIGPAKGAGGELGWISPGRMSTEFDKAVFALKKGALTKPFKSKEGWEIVKIVDKKGKILGCHIIGSQASILIHEVIVAMKAKLGVDGITHAIHVHPALSEVVQRAFNQL